MRTKLIVITLIAASMMTVRSQETPPPANVDPAQAITLLREGLVASFNRGDMDALLGFCDTNVLVTWQNGEVCEGREAVRAYYEKMMVGPRPIVRKITAEPQVIGRHLQGDWAVSWGKLNDTFELTDGSKLNLNSHFSATIARRGDRWLVTAYHASVNAFDNPVLSLAMKKVAITAGVGGAITGLIIGMALVFIFRRPKTQNV
jgi:ketosteroid isomerase-like protein